MDVLAIDFRRGRRSLKHAVYNTPDSQCLDSGVLYIPFIHSRHNAKDRSLEVGRDIMTLMTVCANCKK